MSSTINQTPIIRNFKTLIQTIVADQLAGDTPFDVVSVQKISLNETLVKIKPLGQDGPRYDFTVRVTSHW